jgi:predicted nucleic acid-binding protein
MAVLIDSGFLFATLNRSDQKHTEVVEALRTVRDIIVFPVPAITEVTYLLARDIDNETSADFVESLATTDLVLETPQRDDYSRSAELLRQYDDSHLDFVDALIAAIAERLNITTILTLDRRDFQMVRPKHCAGFHLLP